jgi:hypothetical protein
MPPDSSRSESLYSSNHRRRHRRESGKSKGCGRSESHPIPKQAFAGSNPVTRSRSQEQAHPASDWRPDGSKGTYLIVKNTQDPVPLLHTSASLSPNLARDGPPGNGNPARRSLYSGTSQDPFGAPAPEAKLITRRPVVRVRPPLPN